MKKKTDFQKVKLKVGKRLPKGANETKTSFQTRKINLREQIKDAPEELNLTDLLRFVKSNDVKTKFDNLRKLRKYVLDKKDALSMFFPDILKELGKTLQESDPTIRSEAVAVFVLCVQNLTDMQFKPFVVPVTSYLNCMMTHCSHPVRQDSLKLLDGLLGSHPDITCQSCEIGFGLLNMISRKVSHNSAVGKWGKKKDSRKLTDVINSKKTADEWRMDVLSRMLPILNRTLAKEDSNAMVTDDDEKDIYWNAKEALYLPLYCNSGVQPAKLDYSIYCLGNVKDTDSEDFKKFVSDIMCILSEILNGLVLTSKKTLLNKTGPIVKDLNIIIKILCCIGKWTIQKPNIEDDLNPTKSLNLICHQLLTGFPYSQPAGKSTKNDEAECMQVNLGICYLYCISVLLHQNNEDLKLEQSIFSYLGDLLRVCGKMNEESISLTLKISKIVMQCEKFSELYKNGILVGLYGLLQVQKISPVADDLYSFFMDLSLNYDFTYLLESKGMITWFKSLIKDLNFMMEFNIIKANHLKYIRQVCARKNPHFMNVLNALTPEKFLQFLKFDDETFQLTIIHLIASLDKISNDFLQDLAETIREKSFSVKTATRLIHLLHSRFSKSGVSLLEQMNLLKFLLNLGCDTFLIMDPNLDTAPLPFTSYLISFQQCFACEHEIYLASDFERHRQIFEVCFDCLSSFKMTEDLIKCMMYFMRNMLDCPNPFPVHSVVAFIHLFRRFSVLLNDEPAAEFLKDLVFSCILYNSYVTNDLPENYWEPYGVPAIQDCLEFADATEVIINLNRNLEDFTEVQVCHSLKILLWLYRKRLLETVDERTFYQFCERLKSLDAFHKSPKFNKLLGAIFE